MKLKEVVRENDELFFVFEYMEDNLYDRIKNRDKGLPENKIRVIIYQVDALNTVVMVLIITGPAWIRAYAQTRLLSQRYET